MRTGDKVHHGPSGEDWTVAYVDGDEIAWIGWPPGWAKTSDCTLIEACTDAEHVEWLRRLAQPNSDDKRATMARAALAALSLQPTT